MRTLIYYSTAEDTVRIRTASYEHKKSYNFILMRHEIEDAKAKTVITKDLGNFAELRVLENRSGEPLLQIDFTWISEVNSRGVGSARLERVRIPLHLLEPVGVQGKSLSIEPSMPRIEFHSRKNLAEVAANPYVRRQLSKYLRTAFSWPDTVSVKLHDDFAPYSFYFESNYIAGGRGVNGGLIYHEDTDGTGRYSLHT